MTTSMKILWKVKAELRVELTGRQKLGRVCDEFGVMFQFHHRLLLLRVQFEAVFCRLCS